MVRIAPVAVVARDCIAAPRDAFYYVLGPSAPLPTLDLSLSLASRVLSRHRLDWMHTFVRKRKRISLASWIAISALVAVIAAPAPVGRVCALVALVMWTPAAVASTALLRYDVVCLLLKTHDFWFSTFMVVSTYTTIGVLFGDLRAAALGTAWASVQTNLMIDANIRTVAFWVVLTLVGLALAGATCAPVLLGRIDDLHDFTLVGSATHELVGSKYASSGLLTVMAILTRNLYRKRSVLRRVAGGQAIIECASYCMNLRLSLCDTRQLSPMVHDVTRPSSITSRPEYIKTMQYVEKLGRIDPKHTLWLAPGVGSTSSKSPCFSTVIQCLGALAVAACGVSVLLDIALSSPSASASQLQFDSSNSTTTDALIAQATTPDPVSSSLIVALVATVLYCLLFAAHYQRDARSPHFTTTHPAGSL